MAAARQQKVLWILIALAAVVYAFWLFNPMRLYFLNDDLIHIPLSKDGEFFQRKSMRPVCDLSVRIDYLIWGTKAWGYHLTNLLLHVINTILVYILCQEWFKRKDRENYQWLSFGAALLFFVYAFHSETVFWILGRSASLGALFFIPALIFYLKRNEGWKFLAASSLFFLIGLFTYESVWIFPVVALLISFSEKPVHLRKEIISVGLLLTCFAIYSVTRWLVLGELIGSYEGAAFLRLDVLKMLAGFLKLFFRLFIPPVQSSIIFAGSAIVFLLVSVTILLLFKKGRINLRNFALLFVCLKVSILPYVSLGIDTHSVEGERFLYLPSLFASLLLIAVIYSIFTHNKWRLFTLGLLVVFHLFHLTKAANNYVTASRISSLTFEEINALKGKNRLFIDSLPQSVNGALVFRLGFEEGVKWLKNKGTVDTVIVSSLKLDNSCWSKNYSAKKGNNSNENQVLPAQFDLQTDAWFFYEANGITVTK